MIDHSHQRNSFVMMPLSPVLWQQLYSRLFFFCLPPVSAFQEAASPKTLVTSWSTPGLFHPAESNSPCYHLWGEASQTPTGAEIHFCKSAGWNSDLLCIPSPDFPEMLKHHTPNLCLAEQKARQKWGKLGKTRSQLDALLRLGLRMHLPVLEEELHMQRAEFPLLLTLIEMVQPCNSCK